MKLIKLVIDIDEEMYKDANILIVKDFPILKKAIAEGTPFPKGHGKENMTALEKWKNDFKGFISELSMPRDDYKGIMEYIDEVPIKEASE